MEPQVSDSHAHTQRSVDYELCPWCGQPISHKEFEEIQAKIQKQEKQKIAALRVQFQGEVKAAKNAAEAKAKAELTRQRDLLEKARDQALLKQRAEINRERESLQGKVKEMERKLRRQTAHELGEGAEIDLLEELRNSFPNDRITHVPKGTAGADIHHEVLYKGKVCGRIVFDSKNRQAWRNGYVKKLREDQIAADADHAIVSSTVLPSGCKQLCIENGVIVANPARVIALVELLRPQMVHMHRLRLSTGQRAEKTERLYEFITSERGTQLLDRIEELIEDILQVDVEETKAHTKVWENRGLLLRSLKRSVQEFDAEVSAIVEG